MAFEIQGFQRSWIAGGTAGSANSDLSVACTVNSISCPDGYQYMFVAFNAGGLLVPLTSSNLNTAVGVLQNKPAPGQPATVMLNGVTRLRSADASIVIGSPVYIDQYGMATLTAGTKTTHQVGIAELASANGTGFMISVCLKPFGALL